MNLELLIKLVKLANSNPNENEANLAARKVCKMIEDGKFQFGVGARTSADDIINELHRRTQEQATKTWNDVRRSTEPMWNSKPPNNNPSYSGTWTGFRPAPYDNPPSEEPYRPYYSGINWDENYYTTTNPKYRNRKERAAKPKTLNCKTCGTPTETKFVGPTEMFQCYTCQFNEHNKK